MEDFVEQTLTVVIYYDSHLQRITKRAIEEATVPDNFRFADFLHSLFQSYPKIDKLYPPGVLGFTINGNRPEITDIMKDGDKAYFFVYTKRIH